MNSAPPVEELFELLLQQVLAGGDLPAPDTPEGRLAREFFANNWAACRDTLLTKTKRLRVEPEPAAAPRMFQFEFDLPYKCKPAPDEPVHCMPGPIRGLIIYRPDLFRHFDQPAIAVRLDRTPGYYHPNYSRHHRLICLGELPNGPFPLDALLENHLYPILSYQNRRASHPADIEAARYFAFDPDAMTGLEPVEPLY